MVWRVSSPTDLRCEGDLRDVEGAVPYAVEVRGGDFGMWRGDFF